MPSEEYISCELQLSNYNQAVLRFDNKQYDGKPVLDESLQQRLLEASLDSTQYGTMLFRALFPPNDELFIGYRIALADALHREKPLHFHIYIDSNAPQKLHELHWELLHDPQCVKTALSRSRSIAFSRYTSAQRTPPIALNGTPKLLIVISSPDNLDEQGLAKIERDKSIE